jgi:hypothetical protein
MTTTFQTATDDIPLELEWRLEQLVSHESDRWRVVARFPGETPARVALMRLERTIVTSAEAQYRIAPCVLI